MSRKARNKTPRMEPGAAADVFAGNEPAETAAPRPEPPPAENMDGEPPQALKTVEYEKVGPDGVAEADYSPTSGRMVRVYSKWQHDLRYETRHGVAVVKGLANSPVVGAPYAVSSIPLECWNWIVDVYGKTNMFRNHFVYAVDSDAAGYGDGKAAELADERTGIERLEAGKISVGVRRYKR